MNEALVTIVLNAVKERYVSEKAFYTHKLQITGQSWDRWKKGQQGLKYENMRILSTLFTDYEWMLVQKVVRNADILTEVENDPLSEYRDLKIAVAKKWLATGQCKVVWYTSDTDNDVIRDGISTLRLELPFDFWSYKDVIELHLPGVTRQYIEAHHRNLLEYFETIETSRV